MRIVIDTNILLSAAFRDRLPERVILGCVAQPDLTWLVTPEIEEEYIKVLGRPKFALPRSTLAQWLDLLQHRTQRIEAASTIDLPRDRKDAKFLNCAAAGNADFLLSGDADFDDAIGLTPCRIVSVRQFAAACAPELLEE